MSIHKPKKTKRPGADRRWTLLFIGDHGNVVTLKHFKAMVIGIGFLFFLAVAVAALLFFQNLWLVIPPSVLIIMTAIGGYLYGSGLRTIRNLNETTGLLVDPKSNFYKTVSQWQQF